MSVMAMLPEQTFRDLALDLKNYTWLVIPLPKPRGFWDCTLFASIMTGMLSFLFWLDASDGIGWHDAALASAAAVFFVFVTILARRREKAKWIKQPTWLAYGLIVLGTFTLMFGTLYADVFLFHRRDLTLNRFRHDIVLAILLPAGFLWSARRRFRAKRQVL